MRVALRPLDLCGELERLLQLLGRRLLPHRLPDSGIGNLRSSSTSSSSRADTELFAPSATSSLREISFVRAFACCARDPLVQQLHDLVSQPRRRLGAEREQRRMAKPLPRDGECLAGRVTDIAGEHPLPVRRHPRQIPALRAERAQRRQPLQRLSDPSDRPRLLTERLHRRDALAVRDHDELVEALGERGSRARGWRARWISRSASSRAAATSRSITVKPGRTIAVATQLCRARRATAPAARRDPAPARQPSPKTTRRSSALRQPRNPAIAMPRAPAAQRGRAARAADASGSISCERNIELLGDQRRRPLRQIRQRDRDEPDPSQRADRRRQPEPRVNALALGDPLELVVGKREAARQGTLVDLGREALPLARAAAAVRISTGIRTRPPDRRRRPPGRPPDGRL